MKFQTILILILLSIIGCKPNNTADQPADDLVVQGTPELAKVSEQLEKDPANPQLYALRGQLFYDGQEYQAAIGDFNAAIQLDSANLDYYHLLADAYFDSNQSQPALNALQKVVDKDSTRLNTLLKMSEMQMILKQHEASLATTDLILQQRPRHPEAFYLAGLNFEQMGDTARAVLAFQTTVEENADHIDAYRKLGYHFDHLDKKIALKYFDNALRIDSTDMDALIGKAWYYHQRSKFPFAKKFYEKATQFHPYNPRLHLNNGILHLEMKDNETAYKKFDLAVNIDAGYGVAYFYRAMSGEFLKKEVNEVVNDYRQAAALMNDPSRAAEALERLGAQ